jgi:hypothetical protein
MHSSLRLLAGLLARSIAVLIVLVPLLAWGQEPTSGSPELFQVAVAQLSAEATGQVPASGLRGRVFDADGNAKSNITLIVTQIPTPAPGPQPEPRRISVMSNADGEFEISNLSAGFVKVERENLRDTLGTARQTVMLKAGQTRTVDLGGGQLLTGRLMNSGVPAANVRVRLSLSDQGLSSFVAFAVTTSDGAFEFWNVPPGKWELSLENPDRIHQWHFVKTVEVNASVTSVGNIDHRPVKVLVRCEPSELTRPNTPNLDFRVILINKAAVNRTAISVKSLPRNIGDPYVFDNVPPGQYEVIGTYEFRGGTPDVWPLSPRTEIEVTADRAEHQATLAFPQGTASIHGRLNESEYLSAPLVLWSRDRRLMGFVQPKPDGAFEIRGLPAGEYFFSDSKFASAVPVFEIALVEAEQKMIAFPPEVLRRGTVGSLPLIIISQAAGTPIPGATLRFPDAGRSLEIVDFQDGRIHLNGFAGEYELEIAYPGFRSVRQRVTVPPLSTEAAASPRREFIVELAPAVTGG